MITSISKIISGAGKKIIKKFGIRAVIKNTQHFQERVLQRFNEEDIPMLTNTVLKAFEKASANGKPFRYTHPLYDVTVVIKKLGSNGLELVTCWKKGEEELLYVC